MSFVLRISQLTRLSPEASAWLEQNLEKLAFKKGEVVLREGRVCNQLYFVCSGMLGSGYCTEKKEVCNWIAAENEFATAAYSFMSQKPSYETIECLENATVEAIRYEKLQHMYGLFPEAERAGRLILEEYYSRLEERMISIQFRSAKERYEQFYKSRPEIANRAPLGLIASYLGITPETLSRIRAGA